MNDKERIKESKTGHLYIAIRRSKENDEGKELCFRQVIRDEEQDLDYIKHRIGGFPGVWRIYKTVNARDFSKAWKMVATKLIEDHDNWMYRVDSLWKTCLMKPECKAERKILIDIDTKELSDDIKKLLMNLNEQGVIKYWVETPNGTHIVSDKFDTRILEGIKDIEIKRDGYEFVDKITVR